MLIPLVAAEVVGLIFDEGMSWSALFEKHDFFNRYRYYIQVVAAANNPENMKKWCVLSKAYHSLLNVVILQGRYRRVEDPATRSQT